MTGYYYNCNYYDTNLLEIGPTSCSGFVEDTEWGLGVGGEE